MAKPTTLASQLSKMEAERVASEAQEDKAVVERPVIDGKVWVRLIRPHLDASGKLHEPGIAALDPDAVPSSAKVLSARAAEAAASGLDADELLKRDAAQDDE